MPPIPFDVLAPPAPAPPAPEDDDASSPHAVSKPNISLNSETRSDGDIG